VVHLDNPAVTVMTDFNYVHPVTVDPEMSIDGALQKMKTASVRLLFVIDDSQQIIGLITANDIIGERPIKVVEETRVKRSQIKVETIMTPQSAITVLNMISVRNAQVGHIIETLRQLERQHMLVVDVDESTHTQRVIGIFSASHISKHLHKDVTEEMAPAHSLAEMVHQIR
jgi:CBS domain containing-hemolysin-like protein